MQPDLELASKIVAFLNNTLRLDRAAVSELVNHRVNCSVALMEHPTIPIHHNIEEGPQVGLLGLLNGLCGLHQEGPHAGHGPIQAERKEVEKLTLKRFFVLGVEAVPACDMKKSPPP